MEEFKLIFDNPAKLIQGLNYNKIHVCFDDKVSNSFRNYLLNLLSGKNIVQTVITSVAEESFILSLPFKNEDFVLCVGGVQLQNIVKYYSYMHYIKFGVIPVESISEYTLSSRAFVKDKYYQFYACEKPQFVHVFSTLFTAEQVYDLYKVLSYKNIINFEAETEKVLFSRIAKQVKPLLDAINNTNINIKEVIKLYATIAINLEKNKTYDYLGTDYMLLSFMPGSNTVKELLECQNILVKFYSCLFKFDFIRLSVDVNMHLKKINQNLDISYLDASKKALNIFSEQDLTDLSFKLKAHKPHLEMFLEVCKAPYEYTKTNLSSKRLEQSLTFAADLFPQKNLLRVLRELGYFENLIKDL